MLRRGAEGIQFEVESLRTTAGRTEGRGLSRVSRMESCHFVYTTTHPCHLTAGLQRSSKRDNQQGWSCGGGIQLEPPGSGWFGYIRPARWSEFMVAMWSHAHLEWNCGSELVCWSSTYWWAKSTVLRDYD